MARPAGPGGLEFDLPRAVSLGGAAFKAYCDPKPVHPFEDFDVGDTTVLIMNTDFLKQAFWGVLEVRLVNAEGLQPLAAGDDELLHAPNPSALVSLVSRDSLDARTRPYKFTSAGVSRNPTWDQDRVMLFPVRDPNKDVLHIDLYDESPAAAAAAGARTGRRRTAASCSSQQQPQLGCALLKLRELLGEQEARKVPRTLRLCAASAVSMGGVCGHVADSFSHNDGGSDSGGDGSSDSRNLGSLTIECRLVQMDAAEQQMLEALTTVKTLPMSWDAPMEIGLRVVEWLRRSSYEKVTWQYLNDVMKQAGSGRDHLQPVAFIENRAVKTEAWVFRCIEDRRVVIAFRGTNETADWIIDLGVLQVADDFIRPGRVGADSPADGVQPAQIRLHHGFREGYKRVRKAVLQVLDWVIEPPKGRKEGRELQPDPWTVEVTGHSLGGALATLASYDIAWIKHDRDQQPPGQQQNPTIGHVALVNFGSPRVGNDVFAKEFNALVPDAWRVHNLNDAVSSVPFSFGFLNFTHVGKDVRMGWKHEPQASPREVERWLPLKLLSCTPVSSHLEFRYMDTMLQMVRKWVADRQTQRKHQDQEQAQQVVEQQPQELTKQQPQELTQQQQQQQQPQQEKQSAQTQQQVNTVNIDVMT